MRVPRLWRALAIVTASAAIAGVTGGTTAAASAGRAVGIRIPTRCRLPQVVTIRPVTYRRESAKHWFLYSRLRLARSHKPPAPKFLKLDHSATASKAQRRHSFQFAVTLRFRFRIGRRDAYRWRVNFCT